MGCSQGAEVMGAGTWAKSKAKFDRRNFKGLEWFLIRSFTDGQSAGDCVATLREEGEPWSHIARSIDKCKKFRSSPTHIRGFQEWRCWLDRFDFKFKMMMSTTSNS